MLKRTLAICTLTICGFMSLPATDVVPPSSNSIEINQEAEQEQILARSKKKRKHESSSSCDDDSLLARSKKKRKHESSSSCGDDSVMAYQEDDQDPTNLNSSEDTLARCCKGKRCKRKQEPVVA